MFRHYCVTLKCTIISQIITLLHVSTLLCHPQMHNYFTNYHNATCFDTIVSSSNAQLFHKLSQCYMFRHYCVILKCTTISQIITMLHVSTLLCHPQMHNYFTNYHNATCFDTIMSSSNAHLFHKLSQCYVFRHYCVIFKCTIISQIITMLHVSTLLCHLQMHNYFTNYHNATCFDTIVTSSNAQLFHKLSHCYMFRHYCVILRKLVINTSPSYTSVSNAAVSNTIYN